MKNTEIFSEDEINNLQEHMHLNYAYSEMEGIIVTRAVTISPVSRNSVAYKKCVFKEKVTFENNVYSHSIEFNSCVFENGISINGAIFKLELIFDNCIVRDRFLIESNEFKKDCIWNVLSFDTLSIRTTVFKSIIIQGVRIDSNIDKFRINMTSVDGRIQFENFNLSELYVDGIVSSNSTLHFKSINAKEIVFNNFRNYGVLGLSEVRSKKNTDSTFEVFDSNFGKSEFYNIYFTSFKKLNIYQSNLSDCVFNNVVWKYDITSFSYQSRIFNDKSGKIKKNSDTDFSVYLNFFNLKDRWSYGVLLYNKRLRETFRQLKYALSKQSDTVNEQKFHSREMRAYNRSLHPIKDFFTKLIIKFSYWFSDYGQSYMRPIFWLLVGHYVLFSIASSSGVFKPIQFHWHFELPSANVFYEYFRLLNPLRRPDETFKGYSIIIDIVMRIWSSYMIYNIIRATRRFIK